MENMSDMTEASQPMASDVSTSSGDSGAAAEDPAVTHADLITTHDLSPNISRSESTEASVSVASMIDSTEFRSHMPEPTYQTLNVVNGRMSPVPGYPNGNSYATLTPLQPLPPISTVAEKFGHATSPNVSGSFTLMQNNGLGTMSMGMDMNSAYRYDHSKIGSMGTLQTMNMGQTLNSSPMQMMSTNGYAQPQGFASYPTYSQNGLHSPKPEPKMMSPNTPSPYDPYSRGLMAQPPTSSRLHSPNPVMPTTLNGLHPTHAPSPHSHNFCTSIARDGPMDQQGSKHEVEEINTKELAQKISSELKRYSIPQAVFAQRVLCRSQGTLSDLLRNPKPWSKLKSGRETFRRMWKWLQEPEFQRMSALRLAGGSKFHEFVDFPRTLILALVRETYVYRSMATSRLKLPFIGACTQCLGPLCLYW